MSVCHHLAIEHSFTRYLPGDVLATSSSMNTRPTSHLGGALGQLELRVLELADRLAERLALLGVRDGVLEHLLGAGLRRRSATHSRSCWSFFISIMKPAPSAPSRLAGGTRQSSKNSSLVSCAAMPIFSSCLPLVKPGRAGLDDEERDALVGVRRVGVGRQATTTRSHSWPFEMNVLAPLMT
jgi:hypothetical protein